MEEANDEGGDPQSDIQQQSDNTGAGKPDDADRSDHKTQDLVKAGRADMDPNAGEE